MGLKLWLIFLAPVVASLVLYQLDSFDPAPFPVDELPKPVSLTKQNIEPQKIALGSVLGPEDLLFDAENSVIYTGCDDGWIKKVKVGDDAAETVVVEWVNTGGRPLGLAFGNEDGEVIVADGYKGLLKVSKDGAIELLTDEAEGLKFKLTDAVAVAKNGIMYFTDASLKYGLYNDELIYDMLEGRPHGRFMSYDPSTKHTKVIARDLYFANGVALSPDEDFVIFCESGLMRCQRYYIEGEKEGTTDIFIANIPGLPDNIRYDGEGLYWLALASEYSHELEQALRYPFIRKVLAILEKYKIRPAVEKVGGPIAVDLEGKLLMDRYYNCGMPIVTTGIKIGDHLYCGSTVTPYISRLSLTGSPTITSA